MVLPNRVRINNTLSVGANLADRIKAKMAPTARATGLGDEPMRPAISGRSC